MKLTIIAKPGRKREFIRRDNSHQFTIAVHEPAIDGQANAAIIKILSDYLRIPRSLITIERGHTSPLKIISIPEDTKLQEMIQLPLA